MAQWNEIVRVWIAGLPGLRGKVQWNRDHAACAGLRAGLAEIVPV
jgi:hypothetical protein